jgi:hypothetical protein
MDAEDKGQSGYYQTIARAFLERRGAPFFLSPKDQAVVARWEDRRIPLGVVLEGIGRAFDGLVARGRGAKGIALSYCERQVDAAFAQQRDRTAGQREGGAPAPRLSKRDKVRREIEKALPALADPVIAGLLQTALGLLAGPKPDEAALERLDAEVEEILWSRATEEEKAAAEAEFRRDLRGRRPVGLAEIVRRNVVKAARAGLKIPHISFYYH